MQQICTPCSKSNEISNTHYTTKYGGKWWNSPTISHKYMKGEYRGVTPLILTLGAG